jgi:colicin import membrane protein
MPRPLKVFKTHIGFYDLVVAAPSMKAAAAAWHASPRLFAQGFAAVTQEPETVRAALAEPGLVLKKPHGKPAPWKAEPDAPAAPRLTARQKDKAAASDKARKRKEAQEKRARAAAAKRAKAQAKDELAEIEKEEAALRQRRQSLRRKFSLHAMR